MNNKKLHKKRMIAYSGIALDADASLKAAQDFRLAMEKRRSLRMFSDRPVSENVVRELVMTANTAPSGAHKQPWFFCAIKSLELKQKIRAAAEAEEKQNYSHRMSEEWLEDLKPFGTDENKPYLEIAPWLIVVFKQPYALENGVKKNHYYVNESVGIAVGFLLTAIHQAGLVALTHTPSPMNFLERILNRPENERAFLLIPVGYPGQNAAVPNLKRKSEQQVLRFL